LAKFLLDLAEDSSGWLGRSVVGRDVIQAGGVFHIVEKLLC
jgi:hypothetical protein